MSPRTSPPAAGAVGPRDWLLAVLLGLAALLAYANTLHAPFVFDDRAAILANPTIRDPGRLAAVLSPPADGRAVAGRPFVNLTFALNYALSGTDPWSYHGFNLACHVLAGLLLWRMLRRILPAAGLAWLVALLWTLHPLQTEAVTCVVQRTESLCGLLLLLTLYACVRAAESPGPARGWLGLAVGACLLGMATKEVMVAAPVLVLLYDRTFLAGTFRAAWTARWRRHLALGSTWLLLGWLVARNGGGRGTAAGFASGIAPWDYLQTQAGAIIHYLRLVVWPHPLVFDYGPAAPVALADIWWRGLAVIALLAATGWALARRPAAGFAGAWFFAILAPSSSFIPLAAQPVAEHRMYLPLAAVLALLAAGAWSRLGRHVLLPLAVLGVVAGTLTWRRNEVYRSERSLWTDTVAHAPDNPRALGNLGAELLESGRDGEAAAALGRALALTPDSPAILSNLCNVLARLGRLPEAVAQGERAVRVAPDNADARVNLAHALYLTGNAAVAARDFPAALAAYRRALAFDPGDAALRNNFANALLVTGRREEAIAEYREVLRLRPDDRAVRENLQRALELPAAH